MKIMPVLLADAEPASRLELEALLKRWGYEVRACRNGKRAREALEKPDAPRLVLLQGPGLGRPDGFALTRALRKEGIGRDAHIIMMLAADGPAEVAEALNAGADDYLVRPVQAHALRVRLEAARRILELEAALREHAGRDRLTGLWNHAMILDMVNNELRRGERDEMPVSFILADVDRLKAINEHHGYTVGDELLRVIGERMRVALRSYDMCGRYSGEEFLVVLPRCGRANALEVAERVRQAVAGEPIETSAGPLRVSMSFGVATTARGQRTTAEAVLKATDEACFQAKRQGRNCVEASVSIT